MDENMYRQRIQSLEEHTDKLVERGDNLAAQLAERDAEIAQLKAQVAELQAWKDAVPVDAIAFLVGATEDSLGISWQTRYVAEWANKMPK